MLPYSPAASWPAMGPCIDGSSYVERFPKNAARVCSSWLLRARTHLSADSFWPGPAGWEQLDCQNMAIARPTHLPQHRNARLFIRSAPMQTAPEYCSPQGRRPESSTERRWTANLTLVRRAAHPQSAAIDERVTRGVDSVHCVISPNTFICLKGEGTTRCVPVPLLQNVFQPRRKESL